MLLVKSESLSQPYVLTHVLNFWPCITSPVTYMCITNTAITFIPGDLNKAICNHHTHLKKTHTHTCTYLDTCIHAHTTHTHTHTPLPSNCMNWIYNRGWTGAKKSLRKQLRSVSIEGLGLLQQKISAEFHMGVHTPFSILF